MSRPQVQGLVHSILSRLKNEAKAKGRPFTEVLELFAIERFLHRLGTSDQRSYRAVAAPTVSAFGSMAASMKILGDIVEPLGEDDWESFK